MKTKFVKPPVTYECSPKEFSKLIGINRCDNMDAYLFTVCHEEKYIKLYFTGANINSIIAKLNPVSSSEE